MKAMLTAATHLESSSQLTPAVLKSVNTQEKENLQIALDELLKTKGKKKCSG